VADLREMLAPVWRGVAYYATRRVEDKAHGVLDGSSVDPDGRRRFMRSDDEAARWAAERSDVLAWLPHGCTVYDLGCGDGKLAKARPDLRVYGYDPDEEATIEAHHRGVVLVEPDLDQSVDALWCCHVVEHVHEPLMEIARGLLRVRAGGIVIVETPDFGSPVALEWGERFRLLHDPTHVSLFTSESLVRMLRALNVEIEEVAFPGWFGTPLSERAFQLRGGRGSEVHYMSEDPPRVCRLSPPAPGNVVAVRGRKR
jgi:SAM-dependent methyltransferase